MTSPYHSSGSEYGAEFDLDVPTAEEDVNLPSWLERNARGGGPYSQTTFARREVLAGRLWHALSATGVWSHMSGGQSALPVDRARYSAGAFTWRDV
uniref:SAM-dependent methyltransferase n=1 Tax=Globodera pallida TaxID=36090 RepID=A0A183CG32_GLOPA